MVVTVVIRKPLGRQGFSEHRAVQERRMRLAKHKLLSNFVMMLLISILMVLVMMLVMVIAAMTKGYLEVDTSKRQHGDGRVTRSGSRRR